MMKRSLVLMSVLSVLSLASVARAAEDTSTAPVLTTKDTAGTNLFAEKGRFGLGLGSGNYASGVTGKVFLNDRVALQGILGLGYGFGYGGGFSLNVDGIYEMPKIWGNDYLSINWHVGGGAVLGFYSGISTGVGVEAVGGPSLQLAKVPFEFVVDVRPTVYLSSGWDHFALGSGASVRYFFK